MESQDFIATELLKELKESNVRKDKQIEQLHRNSFRLIVGAFLVVFATVAAFLLYLNQYDFSSTTTSTVTQNAEGLYALIDSEGNVLGYDITPEEFEIIMEVINNGESVQENGDNQNNVED